jgi:hypothetical protein
MLHLPDHLYRDVGIFIDTGLLILLVAIAYLLWRYVQAVRQVHAIGRFWLEHWNDPRGNEARASQKSTVVAYDAVDGDPRLRKAKEVPPPPFATAVNPVTEADVKKMNGEAEEHPFQASGDPIDIVDDFTAEAPAATDAELGQALSRVVAKMKTDGPARALLGQFAESGYSYRTIPALRRSEFLAKLNALG